MDAISNKTVLYIGGFELPDKNAAAQRVVPIAQILKTLGYNVVFVGIDKSIKSNLGIENTKSDIYGFTSYRLKYPSSIFEWIDYISDISYLPELMKLGPTMIIAYNYQSIALYRLYKFSKKHNIPLIADCTEWYMSSGSLIFKIVKSFDTYLRMQVVHPKLDGIITISKYLYNYYHSYTDNVILLPPLVDKEQSKWKNVKQNVAKHERINLIYAGFPVMGNNDRLDLLIDALSVLFDKYSILTNFTIIGLDIEHYYKIYSVKSLPKNIEDYINFKGCISHNEVLQAVANADFEIFLRDDNIANAAGFPTKFVESISCGTPVLTNLSSNIEMFLKEGYNGYALDNSSLECLVNSLLKPLKLSKAKINILKENCKNQNLFDFRNYVAEFDNFLTSM